MGNKIWICLGVICLCAGLLVINPGRAYAVVTWEQYEEYLIQRIMREAQEYQRETGCSTEEAEAYANKLLRKYGLNPPVLPPDPDKPVDIGIDPEE